MDLYILNEIQKLKSGGLPSATGGFGTETPINNQQTVAAFTGVMDRYYHQYEDWNSTLNGRTFYTYAGGGNNDYFTPMMALEACRGNGRTDNAKLVSVGNNISGRNLLFAKHDDIGISTTQQWGGRAASGYNPVGVVAMFIRNPTDADVTRTVHNRKTNYWESGYEGSSAWLYTPNSTAYSTTTAGTWTNLHSRSSGNSEYTYTHNITVPAGKTVIYVTLASAWYVGSWSYYTEHRLTNKVFNLNSTIFDGVLESDMKMTQTFAQANMRGVSGYPTTTNPSSDWGWTYYKRTADFFGDRN